jgi:hypothetical protein
MGGGAGPLPALRLFDQSRAPESIPCSATPSKDASHPTGKSSTVPAKDDHWFDGRSFDSYISLDTAYIQNWSIWLDLKILIRTLSVVAGGTGS